MRLVVAITGATGSVLGVHTRLVLPRRGRAAPELETDLTAAQVHAIGDRRP